MTEAEWLTGTEFRPMLELLKGMASPRKLRLFGAACCRRIPFMADDPNRRSILESVEGTADDVFGEIGASLARPLDSQRFGVCLEDNVAWRLTEDDPTEAAYLCADALMRSSGFADGPVCDLIREVFPNPMRQVGLQPDQLPPEALTIAREMYASGIFDRMTTVGGYVHRGDWRQKAVIGHCHAFRPHVRGCWVIDLVLGHS
jgi:hypothetical protein